MEYDMQERLDKFSVTDEYGEIVLDRVAEKRDLVNRGVRLLHETATLKADVKAILEEAKDKGYCKKNVKALMDNVFKSEIDEKIEELEQLRTEIENLYEGGEDE